MATHEPWCGFNGAARFHARIGSWCSISPVASTCFNGAARFHARIVHPLHDAPVLAGRFNGAARFHARIGHPPMHQALPVLASTGPRAFTRGSDPISWRVPRKKQLQRGRALSRADRAVPSARALSGRSFNGAARFHARIGAYRKLVPRRGVASTGPRAFTRGSGGTSGPVNPLNVLQRGRALSRADRRRHRWASAVRDNASTGPRAFTRGSLEPPPSVGAVAELQRGRALSRADRRWLGISC